MNERSRPRFLDPQHADLDELSRDVAAAERQLNVARARYRRKALWLRADELRRELARVENEAANIRLED